MCFCYVTTIAFILIALLTYVLSNDKYSYIESYIFSNNEIDIKTITCSTPQSSDVSEVSSY